MNRTLMSVSHLVRAMFPGTTQNDVNLHVHIRKRTLRLSFVALASWISWCMTICFASFTVRDESLWPEPRACDRLRELLWLNKKACFGPALA